jgi:Amino acid synthesis
MQATLDRPAGWCAPSRPARVADTTRPVRADHPVKREKAESVAVAGLRKILTAVEVVLHEGGGELDEPLRRAVAAAVVENPWLGGAHDDDLSAEISLVAPELGRALADRVIDALGGADAAETFGKAALVGVHGEVEHGAALIHNPYLGDTVRDLFAGESIIAFSEARGEAGCALAVPMWHKLVAARRSHYQAMEVRVPDAPRPDEIVVAVAGSTGPRPWARIGDRTTDVKVETAT